jgi:hypothetical protein
MTRRGGPEAKLFAVVQRRNGVLRRTDGFAVLPAPLDPED